MPEISGSSILFFNDRNDYLLADHIFLLGIYCSKSSKQRQWSVQSKEKEDAYVFLYLKISNGK